MIKHFPNYKDKKILILGLGLLGRGIKDAIFFAQKGADVTVTDLKTKEQLKDALAALADYPIKYALGGHKEADILNADLVIRNAAVPAKSPFLKFAFKNKIKVDMDESLFAEYCPCPIIGITGTRGKSTTTTLIGHMLKDVWENKNRKVYLAGNLQGEATLPLIDVVTAKDLVVLELSSWQLQGFGWKKISPHIAVFTNVFPDHLNSYKTMREYIEDKKLILRFQRKTDYCVINAENNYTQNISREIHSRAINFRKKDVPKSWQPKLPGEHNIENIAAAIAVGKVLGFAKEQLRESLCSFPGLEHRQEFVAKINDVTFINDTTGTTPIAGIMAISAAKPPIILLAGGATKKLNLTEFAKTIAKGKKIKALILLEGTATDELEKKIIRHGGGNLIAGRFDNFEAAVRHAYNISLPGDTVLLSPGCASFGMFVNEFDRGMQFKKIVNQLRS